MPPCLTTTPARKPARRSGNLRCSGRLRFGTPQVPVRPGPRPGDGPAPAAGSSNRRSPSGSRSWPGREFYSRRLSISGPGRRAAYRAQVAPVSPGRTIRSSSGLCGGHRRADVMRRCVHSTPSGWMPQPLPKYVAYLSGQGSEIIDWRWVASGPSMEAPGGNRRSGRHNGGLARGRASSGMDPKSNRLRPFNPYTQATRFRCRGHLHPSLAAGAGSAWPNPPILLSAHNRALERARVTRADRGAPAAN